MTNYGYNTVTELNASGTIIGTYNVGFGPWGVAIDTSGNAWITDPSSNLLFELVGVAKGPQYWPYTGPQFPGGGNF